VNIVLVYTSAKQLIHHDSTALLPFFRKGITVSDMVDARTPKQNELVPSVLWKKRHHKSRGGRGFRSSSFGMRWCSGCTGVGGVSFLVVGVVARFGGFLACKLFEVRSPLCLVAVKRLCEKDFFGCTLGPPPHHKHE